MNISSRFILILICLFSFKSYGFTGQCAEIFELGLEQNISEKTYSTRKKRVTADQAEFATYVTPERMPILYRVVLGDTNPQIALKLGLEEVNVRSQVTDMIRKFNLTTRTALAAYAVHKSIIDPILAINTIGYRFEYSGSNIRSNPDKVIAQEIWGPQSPFHIEFDNGENANLNWNERAVLLLSLLGYTEKLIMRELNHSARWIVVQRQRISEKMNVQNITAAAAKAVRLKMFDIKNDMFLRNEVRQLVNVALTKDFCESIKGQNGNHRVTCRMSPQKVLNLPPGGRIVGIKETTFGSTKISSKVANDNSFVDIVLDSEQHNITNRDLEVLVKTGSVHVQLIYEGPAMPTSKDVVLEN